VRGASSDASPRSPRGASLRAGCRARVAAARRALSQRPSAVGLALLEAATERVILGVLFLLLVIPFLIFATPSSGVLFSAATAHALTARAVSDAAA
jgi:hypothetical protein